MSDIDELETLVTLALTEPSCKQLCQQLALVSFADVGVWAVAIFIQDHQGQMIMVGQFGLDSDAQSRTHEISHVINEKIGSHLAQDRYVANVGGFDAVGVSTSIDLVVDFGPILIAPLRIPSQMFGVMALFVLDEATMQGTITRTHTLRDSIALNLLPEFRSQASELSLSRAPIALTDRQLTILHKLSLGNTNASIAMNLGFSESTIRHETIRIFRFLGVHDRKHAVTEAERRGLLEIPRTRV
jgi:DNA-binding CsgD family transcriptional regulator